MHYICIVDLHAAPSPAAVLRSVGRRKKCSASMGRGRIGFSSPRKQGASDVISQQPVIRPEFSPTIVFDYLDLCRN